MRIALLSDIHANLPAAQAVAASIEEVGADRCWNLGDIVGIGGSPSEAIKFVKQHCDVVLAGNHDAVIVGRYPMVHFQGYMLESAQIHQAILDQSDIAYLRKLKPSAVRLGIAAWHACPWEPYWEFLSDDPEARLAFNNIDEPIGVYGHTHQPCLWQVPADVSPMKLKPKRVYPKPGVEYALDGRVMINPGSVGRPNVGAYAREPEIFPGAWWALLDLDAQSVCWYQVAYDVDQAQADIKAIGLPHELADYLNDCRM